MNSKYGLFEEQAHDLAEILDIVLYEMSHFYSVIEVKEMLEELKSRPDSSTKEIQEAILVCEEYIFE